MYSWCCSFKWLSESYGSKNTPDCPLDVEKIAKEVLLYVFIMAFPTSLLCKIHRFWKIPILHLLVGLTWKNSIFSQPRIKPTLLLVRQCRAIRITEASRTLWIRNVDKKVFFETFLWHHRRQCSPFYTCYDYIRTNPNYFFCLKSFGVIIFFINIFFLNFVTNFAMMEACKKRTENAREQIWI